MQKTYEIIEIELKPEIIDKLCEYSLEQIKNDKGALIDYIVPKILDKVVENPEEFKKIAEDYRKNHLDQICPRCDFLMDEKSIPGINEDALVCSNCNYSSETSG